MSKKVLAILIFTIVITIASILMEEYIVAVIDGLMVLAVLFISFKKDKKSEDYLE